MRQLILHIGASKTGSSAIQMALYRNREKLREMGVLFPMLHWNLKNGQQPSKGNAKHLARWLMSDEASSKDQVFRRVIECCTQTDATRTVLSSEQMFMFKPKNMAMFVEALDAAGIDVKFVFYVRSIADIALSRQAQLLRRNKDPAARSLGDILSRRLLFKEAIEKLLRLTEPSKLNVRSYDNASEDLPGDFLVNGVALSPEETSQLDLELPRANPSLLGRELRVMEVVNKLLVGAEQSEYVTDLLISAPSRKPSPPTITSQQAKALECFREEVAFVNKHVRNGSIDLWSNKVRVSDEADELSATELVLAEALALSVQARPPRRVGSSGNGDGL